ncbi:major capsid hexamer protein [Gordonia phage SmokingBunny]|uniref:Major capsid hexamer protein n=3 Tax=Wizardvirus TaxID=2169658 RepID=A0A6M3TB51_9CAUD|nr:major head protein [Gordonia phage SmokingBunny]YP_010103623.1 major head protein [Gordonia phage Nubi]YP_010107655.1 major head protein [Gordonia phage Evamon]UVK62343.1 major capsid hexamer protein [Gordonia phage Salvador]WAA20237.1 major capsid hexamer protein [Gordonia phage Togo]QCG77830.1 major capsid hexamer protein [Gordonia phage SmokingBunny]QDH85152.1 major capsid hexamer protein [Gordonia phage Nubi]QJD51514.1 major capsid hexamer protein [Gordonia phage Evamon]
MELTLQDLLDAAHGAGEEGQAPTPEQRATAIREKLAGADRPAIEALQDEAIEKWGELNATDPTDEEGLAGLEALTEFVQVTRSVQSDLDAADEQARARRAEMEAKIKGTKGDAEGGEDEGAEGENAGEGGEGEGDGGQGADDSAAAATESAAEGADGGQGAEGAAAAAAEAAPAAEAVVASAKRNRFDLAAIGKRTPKPKPQAEDERPRGFSITAAARVRGYETGQALDLDGVTAAAQARIENMPRGVKGLVQQEDIAHFKVEYPEELTASFKDDNALLDYAGDQSRLASNRGKGSLVAAGGWCAPSDTLYELSPVLADATAGLVDVAEISVKRGGIRTTEGADYAAIYSGGEVGIRETEAQAIANADDPDYEKVLYRVPCTEFVEKRAGVVYTGIEAGILQNSAYPELTRQHVEAAMAAHAHRVNELTIADMVALSTPVDLTQELGPSVTASVLNGIELIIVDLRYRYRAPESMTLEVVLPIWLKLHVRADLALRSGIKFEQVTNEQINAFFTARGARVQWVYDWQDAFSGVANGFGSATVKETFATSVKAMVYPAGTFVRGRGEVISLGVTYDSVNVRKNDYLEMFQEEKLLVHKRAYKSLVVTLPLAVNGVTSAPRELVHGGPIAPETP